MLLIRMTCLFVPFSPITSNMLADNTVPVFCSRMVQDMKKILTALGAGTEATYQVHVPKIHSFCCTLFPSQRLFLFLQRSRNLEGPLQNSLWAVAKASRRAMSSWKPDLTFPAVPHTSFFALLLFFSQSSFLASCGVHDPDETSGMQV